MQGHLYRYSNAMFKSKLGTEKMALKMLESFLQSLPCSIDQERLEEIRTILVEACLNAIEHGNMLDEQKLYKVELELKQDCLWIRVYDKGQTVPDKRSLMQAFQELTDVVKEKNSARGWGLQFIHYFADHWRFQRKKGETFIEIQAGLGW